LSNNDKCQIITPLYTQIPYGSHDHKNGRGSEHLHNIKHDIDITYMLFTSFLIA